MSGHVSSASFKMGSGNTEPLSPPRRRRRSGIIMTSLGLPAAASLLSLTVLLFAAQAQAQAPGLQWSTNIGARVFAVDGQTNVYANTNGTLIRLSGGGVPVQTNTLCSVTNGLARRDVSGNFYLAGSFDGPQDFGGITLVGGWTNYGGWRP